VRRRGLLAGLAAALLALSAGAPQIVAAFGATRTISLYHIHTKETLTVTYKKDGKYDPDALKKINWLMRDWRENEEIEMDPKTIDLLWEMHTELGSKEPIHIICGYRSDKTNNMLRRTVGGQAKGSFHIRGKAIDAAFPDIPVKQLRYSALIRERGGVGYYPTSGIPFVHVDSGPVRAWPRLPRQELALLFPDGKTQHKPASGGPLTREDVHIAQTRYKDVAAQVAAFFELRNRPKTPVEVAEAEQAVEAAAPSAEPRETRVASADPLATSSEPGPQLKGKPQLVHASMLGALPPSAAERGRLNELVRLASLTPEVPFVRPPEADRSGLNKLVADSLSAPAPVPAPSPPQSHERLKTVPQTPTQVAVLEPELGPSQPTEIDAPASNGWAQQPEFDDDHPEELSYRPFPVAPLLTQSSSADDAALIKLVHPDVVRTLDLLDERPIVLPLKLRPGRQVTEVMWAQQFKGTAVDVSALEEAERARQAPTSLASHSVRTTSR
jgi:uncharacterized protein YcbK (DUF882 family)